MGTAAGRTRSVRRATFGVGCLLIVSACSVASQTGGPPADGTFPATTSASASVAPETAAEALAGRPVAGIVAGGADVVLRVGADGFRLPDDEVLLDVRGDRVLSGRQGAEGENVRLIVRDLAGQPVREFDAGMQIPQEAIVRGDDVFFGGVDVREDAEGFALTIDRGGWVARNDGPPEQILAPVEDDARRYTSIEASTDGLTVGISRCGVAACTTTVVGPDRTVVEIPKGGLIALTNEVALLIGKFSEVTAYAVSDGSMRWGANTPGAYYERYATADGVRFVISSVEDAGDGDGNSTDQLRIEVLDAQTGGAEKTVLVSTERTLFWVAPSLSTDRFVALTEEVLPNPDEGSPAVHVVDLETGRLLDIQLALGVVR